MTTTLSPLSKLSCKNMLVLLAVPLLSAGVLFGGATLVILNIPALKAYAVPIISAVVFVQALFWLWYMNAFRKQHALNWSDVGFQPLKKRQWHLLWQIPLMFVCLILSQVLMMQLFGGENVAQNDNSGISWLQKSGGVLTGIILFVSASILIPLFEEILFRGFVYSRLRASQGVLIATLVSALAFMLFHIAPVLFLYMFVLGLYLAWLYQFHNNLWASAIAHIVLNTTVTLVILLR